MSQCPTHNAEVGVSNSWRIGLQSRLIVVGAGSFLYVEKPLQTRKKKQVHRKTILRSPFIAPVALTVLAHLVLTIVARALCPHITSAPRPHLPHAS